MATRIRLQRHGRKSYAFYSIVIADSRAPRDGKFIEKIGTYNPNTNPATVDLNFDAALAWVLKGAQPSDTVRNILSREGVYMKKHLLGGVAKGAFGEAEAEAKFEAWKNNKQSGLAALKAKQDEEKKAEAKARLEAEKKINEVNSGMYVFDAQSLVYALDKITPNNAQGEYYLTDTLEIIKNNSGKVGVMTAEDSDEFLGVNSKLQLAQAMKIMKKRINEYHMINGVTITDPENTYIGKDVQIAPDTIIYPGCMLEGKTKIGKSCIIGPNTRMTSCDINDCVTIQSSTLIEAQVKSFTTVGPYAYLRPNSKIGEHVRIGDFVEVKNSTIDDGTKVSHLTYVGDSDVGKCVNFGCGTVTVNYDGKVKNRCKIGDGAFIGCNTNLVAPVEIAPRAYTAAGSTITKNVPEDSLAIARARQDNKEGWRKKVDK